MEAYTYLSQVYDSFMDNVDYKEWGNYLVSLLKEYNIEDGLVLELGCGTGSICEYLAKKGYDVIGIDNSYEMLNRALNKKTESGHDILYLNQDMREFELYGTVKAIVSLGDSMNYITEKEELKGVFKLVNNYLDPGGMFIFDLNTDYKYRNIGDSTIAENRDESSFIWENTYFEDERINRYDLTLFLRDEEGKYDKYEESHFQKAYFLEEIKQMLQDAGMEFVCAYNAFTRDEASTDVDRVYIIAKEHGKDK